jgi:phosphatidylinositol alpha-mannosyltransferase
MKIGLVFDDSLDRPDGVQQYLKNLGTWLASQGHEVHYLVGETTSSDLPHIHSLTTNIRVSYNGNRLSIPKPANNRKIKQLLEQEQFDVLHVMMPYSPMLAHKIIRYAPARTAVIGTFHILPQSLLVRWSTHALGIWLRSSLKRFDKVLAVSPAAARFAESAFGLSGVTVLPNVTTVSEFADAEPYEKYDDTIPTVMFLGRLVPRKGCATLLNAVAEVKSSGLWPIRVVICGKGPQDVALLAQVELLGIKEAVEFTGFISEEDKPRYVASSDIIVFPSLGGESFGIVLLEGMAAGRPVVLGAANPGYASVMEQRPDQLFAPGDSHALAEMLKRFIQDKAAADASRLWQSEYIKQFDVPVVGARLVAEYAAQVQQKSL